MNTFLSFALPLVSSNDDPQLLGILSSQGPLSTWLLIGLCALALLLVVKVISLLDKVQGLIKLEREGLAAFETFQKRRPMRFAFRYGLFLALLLAGTWGAYEWQQYETKQQAIAEADAAAEPTEQEAPPIDIDQIEVLTDEQSLAIGASIYSSSCAICHGKQGEGGTGPSFTDNEWIHGDDLANVYKTIRDGVPATAMISWEKQLSPQNIHQVASYILSMQENENSSLSQR